MNVVMYMYMYSALVGGFILVILLHIKMYLAVFSLARTHTLVLACELRSTKLKSFTRTIVVIQYLVAVQNGNIKFNKCPIFP